jgi:ABC-type transport system involved in multi-copper enzyme maturation permease subunit
MTFMHALSAEFLKLFTTRLWWILALTLFLYVGAMAGGLGALFGWAASNADAGASAGVSPLPAGLNLHAVIYSMATTIGYVFPVLLGAFAVTGEFRHQTLTPTFLATPRRGIVLSAKVLAMLLVGAGLGVVAWLATVGLGAAALGAFDLETGLGAEDSWLMIARGVLAMALWAAVGVGLGTLVPSQVAALIIVIAFTQFVEPTLRLAASFNEVTASIARFLPGAASDALVGASFYSIAMPGGGGDALLWWQGGIILLAIAVAATVGGYFTSWRRDVT